MIKIITPGFYSSVQDAGRPGYRSIGVGVCGAMDAHALATGNAALGNSAGAAAIEITFGGFVLEALNDLNICLTGANVEAHLDSRPISRWWVQTIVKGQRLKIGKCLSGMRVYLCVQGGIAVPEVLGSRSTDMKGGFGGVEGRLLKAGDLLSIGVDSLSSEHTSFGISPRAFPQLWRDLTATPKLRIIPAKEWDDLDSDNQDKFLSSKWQISPESNRVGYRFSGPILQPKIAREMLSHGILPGTIQLPPSGQPIVQLMDANTAGGYPKIAKIIEADMHLLAQVPLGKFIQFEKCSVQDALDARDMQCRQTERIRYLAATVQGTNYRGVV